MVRAAVSWQKVGRLCDHGLFGERLCGRNVRWMRLFPIEAVLLHCQAPLDI